MFRRKEDTLLEELVVGILFYGIVVQVLLFIISDVLIYHTIGLWVGIGSGTGMAVHMKRTLEDALEFDEKYATSRMKRAYAMRLAVLMGIFFGLTYLQIGSVVTAFIGVMSLKISAYLQPHIHKLFQKYK